MKFTCMLMLCAVGAAELPPLSPVSEPAAIVTNAVQTYARTLIFDDGGQSGITNCIVEVNGWRTNTLARTNRVELVEGANLVRVAFQRAGQTSAYAATNYWIGHAQVITATPQFTLGSLRGPAQRTNAWPSLHFTNPPPQGAFSFTLSSSNVIVEGPVP